MRWFKGAENSVHYGPFVVSDQEGWKAFLELLADFLIWEKAWGVQRVGLNVD